MGASVSEVNKLERIYAQLEAGVPVKDVLRLAVGGSIPRWAARIAGNPNGGFSRQVAQMTMASKLIPPPPRVVAALAEEIGCSAEEIIDLLKRGAVQNFATSEALSA